LGYDDKTGLVVIAGDGSGSSSSSLGYGSSGSSSSSSGQSGLSSADVFAAEGVTVSAWQLREQELTLKFSLGRPQVGGKFTLGRPRVGGKFANSSQSGLQMK
jgi:hypothetical protein